MGKLFNANYNNNYLFLNIIYGIFKELIFLRCPTPVNAPIYAKIKILLLNLYSTKTATAITEVQTPFLLPSADCTILVVLNICCDAL